jgi:hypothetical protein
MNLAQKNDIIECAITKGFYIPKKVTIDMTVSKEGKLPYIKKISIKPDVSVYRGKTNNNIDLGEWWITYTQSTLTYIVKDSELKKFKRNKKINKILKNN